MPQWEFAKWLFIWILETTHFEFEWDDGNSTKNSKKHGLETDAIEAVFRAGLAFPLGIQISPASTEIRMGIIGPTLDGKFLQVVFTLRNGRVRVISARTASKKERTLYEEIRKKA